jgi:hypothetical protein
MPIQEGSLNLCCFLDKGHIHVSLDTNSNRSILTYLAVDKGALFALALCCKKLMSIPLTYLEVDKGALLFVAKK